MFDDEDDDGDFEKAAQEDVEEKEADKFAGESAEKRLKRAQISDALDSRYGFDRYKESFERVGWLVNMHPTDVIDDGKRLVSAVDYYFIQEDGSRFKLTVPYRPYFYVGTRANTEREVASYLNRRFSGKIVSIDCVQKVDLDLANHLTGLTQSYLKLSFLTVDELVRVKREIQPIAKKNAETEKAKSLVVDVTAISSSDSRRYQLITDQVCNILDIREHDVPYHIRAAIDLKMNVGRWYAVRGRTTGIPDIKPRPDLVDQPEPVILAYDLETTKSPLKFPDARIDQIMMISYMINGKGFLICNREIVGQDIENFSFTPRPEYEGSFTIFNESNELASIQRFLEHIQEVKPNIIVTYNGDSFDWAFLEQRALANKMDINVEMGFSKVGLGEYLSRPIIHMDCLCWVKRDSYLPVGSHGLKAVAKAKLRYDPHELDPEDMLRMASEQPQTLANYSVSDAVATFYLYQKYVHPFIFALCTIIPMTPDEVLRKGSGTLCETLLMVQAYHAGIIYPNKQVTPGQVFTPDGHVLESETYVGGHVEALESGVFRADIPCRFRMNPDACQTLIENVERTVKHAVTVENRIPMDQIVNFNDVCTAIIGKLSQLRDCPNRLENPVIYHLDVGAMYPNIILTNRLQPPALVDEAVCAACDFNRPGARCQRRLNWVWRGEIMPLTRTEVQHIDRQLATERFPPGPNAPPNAPPRYFHQLDFEERVKVQRKRMEDYCKTVYKRVHVSVTKERVSTVCMRENSFYVDTVRAFRDRRYEFKDLVKVWKRKSDEATKNNDPDEVKRCNAMTILYDSLQLAHKCILNSFYGYVMRRGSRWFSMEMAGIVCHTGANIITRARQLIEQVGRPLELDTDGIWCAFPRTFPENYTIETTNPKKPKVTFSYAGAVLNLLLRDEFTNDQYHELLDPEHLRYEIRAENTIFFEVDGPYLAMVLPASKEEGKKLKKRYAVFNFDKSLAELKGFEIKRRGELQLIKIFQSAVFEAFLRGITLQECYAAVASIADFWLDVLFSKGADLPDDELFDLISENRSMSRKLEDYGKQKSTSISTARRLAEFLGNDMVRSAGLSCRFVIAKKPEGVPVAERAIPLAIFQAEPQVRNHYLRKWLKTARAEELHLRAVLDWEYYIERLSSAIMKIITIPAALQGLANPVPRVVHPPWLHKFLLEKSGTVRQHRITDMFDRVSLNGQPNRKRPLSDEKSSGGGDKDCVITDIEDVIGNKENRQTAAVVTSIVAKAKATVIAKNKKGGKSGRRDEVVDISKTWRDVLGEPPSSEDFKAWLSFHKTKWRYQISHMKALRKTGQKRGGGQNDGQDGPTSIRGGGGSNTSGIISFLRPHSRDILDLPWQIVEMAPTGDAGLYRVWAVIGSNLYQLKLNVPRIFYVHQATPRAQDSGPTWRRVNKLLPRGQPVSNLYEYRVPEYLYQQHAAQLQVALAGRDVLGVYELQVPSTFRALAMLGCVAQVSPKYAREARRSNRDTDSFDLGDLEFRTLAQFPYLESNPLSFAHFYHHVSNNKQFFGLFVPDLKKAYVFVNDTVRTNQMPNLNTMYNNERNNYLQEQQLNEMSQPSQPNSSQHRSNKTGVNLVPESDYQFEVRVETDLQLIYRQIGRILSSIKPQFKKSPALMIQSPFENFTLESLIPTLNTFPMVRINASDPDNLYAVLDWQRQGSRRMIGHFLAAKGLLSSAMEQCRYLHIPVGNLPADSSLFASDLFFARHLLRANHVWFASRSPRPDLGGKEEDDARFYLLRSDEDGEGGNSASRRAEVNNPSCYMTVSFDLDIACLAIGAVLQSGVIRQSEGVVAHMASATTVSAKNKAGAMLNSGVLPVGGAKTAVDEMVDRATQKAQQTQLGAGGPSQPQSTLAAADSALYNEDTALLVTFRLLKAMVQAWVIDVTQYRNVFADLQIVHFYRWLRSPASLFHDPAMVHAVHTLMTKLFGRILAEFHRLGTKIVYANASRIMLNTKKWNIDDAQCILDYILGSLRENQMFSCLNIRQNGIYRALFWLDPVNFAGIREDVDKEPDETGNGEDEDLIMCTPRTNPGQREPNVVMNWNFARHLTEQLGCQANFRLIVAGYVTSLYKCIIDERRRLVETPIANRRAVAALSDEGDPIAELLVTPGLVDFCRNLIKGDLGQEMFGMVSRLQRKSGASSAALNFVKAVLSVIELDATVSREVENLRDDLLRILGLSSFSADAIKPLPGFPRKTGSSTSTSTADELITSFVLPEVICLNCNYIRDLDILRDPCLRPGVGWYCVQCETDYDRGVIEETLISTLRRRLLAFSVQDIECVRCHLVAETNLARRCACSGTFEATTKPKMVLDLLQIFAEISNQFDFKSLQEVVSSLLELHRAQ